MVKLRTDSPEGVKALRTIPDFFDDLPIKNGDFILNMGTLANTKRFMKRHRDFKDCDALSSMRVDEWAGTKTYDDYLTLLDEGDANVMKQIKDQVKVEVVNIFNKYEEIREYKFDVTGDLFDVGLVMTGVPEAWLHEEITNKSVPSFDFIINATFGGSVGLKEIIKGASRILGMAKVLEDNGVHVSIKVASTLVGVAAKKNTGIYIFNDVKSYDEPINYKKVSALISPTYLRRGMFKIVELISEGRVRSGYGSCVYSNKMITINNTRQIDELEKRLFAKGK